MVGPEIRIFENLVLEKVKKLCKFTPKPDCNLTRNEQQALLRLQQNKNIVIKPCDKGGGIVLLETDQYKHKVSLMLGIPEHYSKANNGWQREVKKAIQEVSLKAYNDGLICEKEYRYLNPTTTRVPILYGLPKVHKTETDPPFRPIVSTVGSITEPLSKFVETFLKTRVVQLPAYIKDTGHIISILEGARFNPDTEFLVTMDIEALYTNIPQYEAWQAVRQIFDKEGMTDHLLFVLDCLKIVLESNFFEFDGKTYQQKKGVSMGAACAPSVANIYVGLFEQTHIYNKIAPFYENIRLWSRYIDDVFFIWSGHEEQLEEFCEWINLCDTNL
ncbi:hypothetical protein NDU88_003640 [Pleurodeles waltl]|uniref:Reverse transcriptase domain-containing protein n=1 Tax=Pleurodeles waltl TaxID=8319 RepID=A0AAV7W834_PLEWA|nr:hypothetical protein NDU88_003640 [Pleurodeles waltl]